MLIQEVKFSRKMICYKIMCCKYTDVEWQFVCAVMWKNVIQHKLISETGLQSCIFGVSNSNCTNSENYGRQHIILTISRLSILFKIKHTIKNIPHLLITKLKYNYWIVTIYFITISLLTYVVHYHLGIANIFHPVWYRIKHL
jgi:hypothetical protein